MWVITAKMTKDHCGFRNTGLENSDKLGAVTNYANRRKLNHRSSYTSSLGQVFVAVKSEKVAFMRRKLHICAHLTVKDLTQPIFVCAVLAKGHDFLHFHLQLISGTVELGYSLVTSLGHQEGPKFFELPVCQIISKYIQFSRGAQHFLRGGFSPCAPWLRAYLAGVVKRLACKPTVLSQITLRRSYSVIYL